MAQRLLGGNLGSGCCGWPCLWGWAHVRSGGCRSCDGAEQRWGQGWGAAASDPGEGAASVPVSPAPLVAFASTRKSMGGCLLSPWAGISGHLSCPVTLKPYPRAVHCAAEHPWHSVIPESEQWLCACPIGHMMRLISCDVIISLCQQNGLILPIVWLDRQQWACPALLVSTKACLAHKVCQCFCWCCLILCGSPLHVKQFLFAGTHRLCFCASHGGVGCSDLPKCIQASPDTPSYLGPHLCATDFSIWRKSLTGTCEANSFAFGSLHD